MSPISPFFGFGKASEPEHCLSRAKPKKLLASQVIPPRRPVRVRVRTALCYQKPTMTEAVWHSGEQATPFRRAHGRPTYTSSARRLRSSAVALAAHQLTVTAAKLVLAAAHYGAFGALSQSTSLLYYCGNYRSLLVP
jgi:hypothetical protein